MTKPLKEIIYNANPENNGGESFTIITKFYANGDKITATQGVFVNQEIALQSYSNSASLNLCGNPLMPKQLRELADLIDSERAKLI